MSAHPTRRDVVRLLGAAALVPLVPLRKFTADLGRWTGLSAAAFYNRCIPSEAHTQMVNLAPDGLATVSFTPANGWAITTLKGRRFARNIPGDCYNRLLQYLGAGHRILVVAFPPQGGNSWVVVTDQAVGYSGLPSECADKIREYRDQKRQVLCVAFPPEGGNRWVVVARDAFFARNIPDECYQILCNLSQRPRPGNAVPRQIHQVSFAPNGGWAVLANDYVFGRNVPGECYSRMQTFQAQGRRVDNVAFSPQQGGWSVFSNGSAGVIPRDQIRTFESRIMRGSTRETIWERMRWSNVPGVSVACVIGNQIARRGPRHAHSSPLRVRSRIRGQLHEPWGRRIPVPARRNQQRVQGPLLRFPQPGRRRGRRGHDERRCAGDRRCGQQERRRAQPSPGHRRRGRGGIRVVGSAARVRAGMGPQMTATWLLRNELRAGSRPRIVKGVLAMILRIAGTGFAVCTQRQPCGRRDGAGVADPEARRLLTRRSRPGTGGSRPWRTTL